MAAITAAIFSLSLPGHAAPEATVSAGDSHLVPAVSVLAPNLGGERQTVRVQAIPFHRVMRMSADVPAGQTRIGQHGVPGILMKTFRVSSAGGRAAYQLLSQRIAKAPINEVTLAGIRVREACALPSRSGTYDRTRELEMTATGYSPMEGSGTGRCATGMRAGYGVVAVDPRVIPLGSLLYIRGYGYAVAGDTGGAIKRNRIDLGSSSYREALQVGRRRVTVYVLSALH